MQFKVKGKITRVFPVVSGTTSGGKTWSKQEYLMETIEEKPQNIYFQVFGDQKMAAVHANVQDIVELTFTISCREYNGRYFTNLEAEFLDVIEGKASTKSTSKSNKKNTGAGPAAFEPSDDTSDLPF